VQPYVHLRRNSARGRRRLRGATRAALEATGKLEVERHRVLRWAARLKRVFAIEIDAFPFTCLQGGDRQDRHPTET